MTQGSVSEQVPTTTTTSMDTTVINKLTVVVITHHTILALKGAISPMTNSNTGCSRDNRSCLSTSRTKERAIGQTG